jgi:hypothetical protein
VNDLESRYAVEHILEDESLTADLVDDAAAALLEWAAQRAEAVVQRAEPVPSSVRDDHIALIRWAMKRVNQVVGQYAPEDQVAYVRALLEKIEEEKPSEDNVGA